MEHHQKTENELLKCMKTFLQSMDNHYIQSCSISMVPEELKKSSKDDAYIPRVVSMGPRYKGSREELMHMEEIKLRCMLSLFHRAGKHGEASDYFKICNNVIWKLNDQIRASYLDEIDLEPYKLTKMMLVDGCFLLELLISKGLDRELPSRLNVVSHPAPAPQVLQNDDVLSDLTLFENQIPIFILHELSIILFPHHFDQNLNQRANKINSLALSILGYSLPQNQSLYVESPHLLDVVHSFVNNNNSNNHNHNDRDVVVLDIDLDDTETQCVNVMELKLNRCASRLQAAGVSIQLAHQDKDSKNISCFGLIRNFFGGGLIWLGNTIVESNKNDMLKETGARGLNFEFKFEKGKLEIAPLYITKTTKTKWRNVIAWEHHKMDWKKSSSNKGTNRSNDISNTCGKFTSAALIFNDLICCANDVKLLKDKNIIVDYTKKSNIELEEFIHTMSFGVDHGIISSTYVRMVDELNKYYSTTIPLIRIWKLLYHLLTYHLEWLIKFMKKEYHFVATVVSLLTVVQTVYAIIAYQLPK